MGKTCKSCNQEKQESEFHWRITGVRRAARCKVCVNADNAKKHRNQKKYENPREKEKMAQKEESELFNQLITRGW